MSELLKIYKDTDWTAFALILFLSFFIVLLYRVCFSKDSKKIEDQKWQIFDAKNNSGVTNESR